MNNDQLAVILDTLTSEAAAQVERDMLLHGAAVVGFKTTWEGDHIAVRAIPADQFYECRE